MPPFRDVTAERQAEASEIRVATVFPQRAEIDFALIFDCRLAPEGEEQQAFLVGAYMITDTPSLSSTAGCAQRLSAGRTKSEISHLGRWRMLAPDRPTD